MLLQFEFGNAVAQQPANAVGLFVHRDPVAGAVQLLRCCQPRRTRTDDRNSFSRYGIRRLGTNPAFRKSALNYIFLDLLDRYRQAR